MSSLADLCQYGSDDDEIQELRQRMSPNTKRLSKPLTLGCVDAAPNVVGMLSNSAGVSLVNVHTSKCKELSFNPKYDDLFAEPVGPVNPFKTQQQRASKNTLTGFVEPAHVSDFSFETERRTFESYGFAQDPSADNRTPNGKIIETFGVKPSLHLPGTSQENKEITVFENRGSKKRIGDQRERERNFDPTDANFTGPWGKFKDEITVAKPDEEMQKILDEYSKKSKKLKKVTQEETAEEKSVLNIKDPYDYQGRSFLEAPHDVGVNLKDDVAPSKCFVPKKQIHSWAGHTKGVQCMRWFPKTAHLLLSGGMDCKVKLWEVYKGRRLVRSYFGHKLAVRDVTFNNDGGEFLTASYDRYIKLWDTETGQVKQRFHTGKVPYCVKFNPDDDKQNMFLAGMQDKKIIQWDTRTGEIVQEYDRHLGAVNTITFFDQNRRFCSSSDDKSIRIWEWEIPVDTKLIQEPSLHSMPAVTMSPNQKWMAGQSMDNKVMIFQVVDEKLRFSKKKNFRGHMVAGYACTVDFSPDMSYLISGDADGKLFIWDWKTHRIVAKWKAHDKVCIGALWHPHETSKIATCGWDGAIKFWD